ncbi:MAG: MFS transporter [Akkermansia sp.]|nr:MFS transporter [Akkermansia sp.]
MNETIVPWYVEAWQACAAWLIDTLRACSEAVGVTLWGAVAIAVAAVVLGLKNGFKNKPVAKAAPAGGPGKWAWVCVAVLWVVVMLNYFDRQLLAVLNQSITEGADGIQMSQADFGMVTSAFLIVYAALSPVGGFLADRFSRKFIILCSLVVWSAVTYMTGKAGSYEELIFWRALMGVSEAFYIPAALALISDYHRGKTRSMATGIHMSGIYAGQVLAGCGAMMAGDPCQLGWRLTFETFGFIGVAYALIVIFFLRDPEGATPEELAAEAAAAEGKEKVAAAGNDFTIMDVLRNLFSGRAFPMLLVAYAIAGFANWFLMGWYPRLLIDMFNIPEAEAGPQATSWINFAKYGAVLIAAVVADMWYARTNNPNARAYVPGIGFCLAGPCVVIAMLPALGLPIEFGLAMTLGLVAMQGVAQGSLDATLMPVLRSQIDERFSATGYGLLNLTSVGAGALISWLGGYLKDANIALGIPLSVAGALMVVCGLMFFFLPRKKQA